MDVDVKISKKDFQTALQEFRGTEKYHRHTIRKDLFLLLTDGCQFVRENAGGGAYWLFDLILSWQMKLKKHRFQCWLVTKQEDGSFYIECSDGNHNFLIGQEVPYSDFPLDKLELWVVDGVALLPSEY